MNSNAVSAECAHRFHSQCDYEDCACNCHLIDRLQKQEANPWDDEDAYIAACGEYQ